MAQPHILFPHAALAAAEFDATQYRAKRVFDICVALLLLVIISPLWVLLWILVRSTSAGPALFRQARVGRDGKEFVLYKFRSMVMGDDVAHRRYVHHWIASGEHVLPPNGTFKIVNDPRITPVGRLLRKYSLDELPQLLNVLRGQMSLVGPRPAMAYEVAQYEPWQRQRLRVLPGLTGLWQVSGRNQVSFARMLELDLEYIRSQNLLNDLRILLRTFLVVLKGTGH